MTNRSNNRDPRDLEVQRRGLLAKVHIAKAELDIPEDDYRILLAESFGTMTAAALALPELERLVRHFQACGWIPRRKRQDKEAYIAALRERIRQAGAGLNSPNRLRGLCRSICGVDDPIWTNDIKTLKRLLAAIEKIKRQPGK